MRDVLLEHTEHVALAEDKDVIETLAPQAAEIAFAHSIGLRCSHRCAQDLDTPRLRNPVELAAELAVVVADQQSRALLERGRLAELLGRPHARRRAGDSDVHDLSRTHWTPTGCW